MSELPAAIEELGAEFRRTAGRALTEMEDTLRDPAVAEEALRVLTPLSRDSDMYGIRLHAVEALGHLRDPRAAVVLSEILNDSDVNSRCRAARALAKMGETALIIDALQKADRVGGEVGRERAAEINKAVFTSSALSLLSPTSLDEPAVAVDVLTVVNRIHRFEVEP